MTNAPGLYSYIQVMGDPVYCYEDSEYRKDRAAQMQ